MSSRRQRQIEADSCCESRPIPSDNRERHAILEGAISCPTHMRRECRVPPQKSSTTEQKLDNAIGSWMAEQRRRLDVFLERCGSPIERLFLLALVNNGDGELLYDMSRFFEGRRHAESIGTDEDPIISVHYIYVYQQFPVCVDEQNFRLDFAFFCRSAKLGIELDGHDFHERTKEQVQKDKSRDRLLQGAGWRVLRFTGSEVWRDAAHCAQECVATAFHLGDGA